MTVRTKLDVLWTPGVKSTSKGSKFGVRGFMPLNLYVKAGRKSVVFN